jgi:hypothetical protein
VEGLRRFAEQLGQRGRRWVGTPCLRSLHWLTRVLRFVRGARELIEEYWAKQAKKGKKGPGPRKSEVKESATPASTSASRKRTSPEEEPESISAPPKKRGRPPKEKPQPQPVSESEEEEKPVSKAPAKKGRKSIEQHPGSKKSMDPDAMDEDEQEFGNMRKWQDMSSWEHLIHHIDTVEKNPDGKLYVYFQL